MRITSLRSSIVTVAACALAGAGLAGCSSSEPSSSNSSSSAPEAASSASAQAAEEGDSGLSIVTSTNVWSDIADEVITSDNVTITPIINGDSVDPHSFSPSAADLAKAKEADLVVVGGGDMDAWLTNAVTDQDRIIHALPLKDDAANPHVWYDLDKVSEVAQEIETQVKEKDSSVTTDAAAFTQKLDALKDKLSDLPQKSSAATEPIAEYLLAASPLQDVTPEGYRNAAEDEGEPAAADVAEFLDALKNGRINVLIFNPQAETDVAVRIRDAADNAGVPVVEMMETPATGESYLDFMSQNVDSLQAAIQS